MESKNKARDSIQEIKMPEESRIVYDEGWKVFYLGTLSKAIPAHEDTHKVTVCLLENFMPEESSLLCAGVGTGLEAILACGLKPQWTVTGFDPSGEMIKIAQERVKALKIEDRLHLLCCFAQDLPGYIKFEGAASFLVYHYLKTKEERIFFLEQIRRVLRPGAPFALVAGVGKYGDDNWATEFFSAGFGYAAHSGLGKKKDVEKQLMDKMLPETVFLSDEEIIDEFNEAGFTKPKKYLQMLMMSGYIAFNQ